MVTASARKKLPVTPVTAISGRKTTTGVMVEKTSGRVTSASALRTACTRVSPESRCSTMFSTTTMASSMTRPIAAASPPSVIRLKLWPMIFREDERHRDGDWNHQAGDQRRTPVAQEKE